ncbi:cadherin repeat domain-containing protein [Ekhidna sp.]|uniref:cadherin repeat domain-containing protein n=1 Tax=Ekhidna sp. TaxID=2608089 RepID=UPI003B5ACD79
MKHPLKAFLLFFSILGLSLSIGCKDDESGSGSNRPPILEVETFEINENATIGSSVGIVKSIDQDGDIVSFSITAGNGEGKFEINELSGEISLTAELDYETTTSYALTVRGDDGNDFSEEDFTINVLDVDETASPIIGTWNVDASSVTYDGGPEGDWTGFVLVFGGDVNGGSYSSSNVPSGYEDVWPASGTWEYTDESKNAILRDDQITIDLSASETSLTVEFTVPDPGARTNGLYDAPWFFQFSK